MTMIKGQSFFIKTEGLVDHVQSTVTVTEQIKDIIVFWIRFDRLQQISNGRLVIMIGDFIFTIEVIHINCFPVEEESPESPESLSAEYTDADIKMQRGRNKPSILKFIISFESES